MEFCYTLPLQRRLNMNPPLPRTAAAPFFCWDAHALTVQGRKTVLAMNRASRCSLLLYGMNGADWTRLPELIRDEIRALILREGLSEFEAARYFALAGPLNISGARSPKSAAALNWAMRVLLQYSSLLDDKRLSQPQAAHMINGEAYHTADRLGSPREFFLMGFRNL
ncbi:MAG: hypothetical protein K2P22_00580 [Lachnospiraceae bacterium]|nr:hypothetical protein [Lachnospiraceae bacterium]